VHINEYHRVGALVLLTALASAIPVNSGRPFFRNAHDKPDVATGWADFCGTIIETQRELAATRVRAWPTTTVN
jgi:hypothetical protein